VIDDVVAETIILDPTMLPEANRFARVLSTDRNFTHFQHTSPQEMLGGRWEVHVTFYGRIMVAWGQIEKFPNNPHKLHVARLGYAVLPEFRGKGFGGAMMDHTIRQCKEFKKLTASVYMDNITMLGMFVKRGFIIEGCFVGEETYDNRPRHVVSLARYQ